MFRKVLFTLFMFLAPSAVFSQGKCASGLSPDEQTKAKVYWLPHFTAGGGEYLSDGYRLANGWDFMLKVFNPDPKYWALIKATWYEQNGNSLYLNEYETDLAGGYTPHLERKCETFISVRPMSWSAERFFSLAGKDIKTGLVKLEVLPALEGQEVDLNKVPAPDVTAVLTYQYKVGGKVASQAAVMQVQPAKSFSFSFRKANGKVLDQGETAVAVANPNSTPVTVKMVYYENGWVDSRNESYPFVVTIPAYGQISKFVSELQIGKKPSDGPLSFWGTMVVQSVTGLDIVLQPVDTNGGGDNFTISTSVAVSSEPGLTRF